MPLLERLKFLAIFESNLDEFFMVRVGGLQQKVQAGIAGGSGADRMPPREQLERIGQVVRADGRRAVSLPARATCCRPWRREGIVLRGAKDLTDADRKHLRDVFRREIFPVLTPLAIDPGPSVPAPAQQVAQPGRHAAAAGRRRRSCSPSCRCPAVLPRFVPLPAEPASAAARLHAAGNGHPPAPAGTVPRHGASSTTPSSASRATASIEIDDDEVEDLLKTIEEEVRKRRRGAAVRLEIEADAPPEVEQFLMHGARPRADRRLPHSGPARPDRAVPDSRPAGLSAPARSAVRAAAGAGVRAGRRACGRPSAAATSSCIIPTSRSATSSISSRRPPTTTACWPSSRRSTAPAAIRRSCARLQRAADNGKQVTAVIELKARLDEERNILWARELEKAGVHVVFGFVGLKTHCKVALVVRREDDGIRRYVHLATGNYNPQTARIYTDLGFFTCNPDFCEDASALFNYLTGYCELPQWRKLVVAPSRLQAFMIEKIEQETAMQQAGKEGRIIAKINGLLEPAIVQALYRASQAGVRIDLICRGICALRPGMPGVSDNIRVISIVDRFLEHSRIFYFGNDGDPQVYIGSADWMDRNLSRRVEVVFPIEQPDLKQRLIREILATSLADNVKARELLPTAVMNASNRSAAPASRR